MRAVTAARMRLIEQAWMESTGETELLLMERAAAGVYQHAKKLCASRIWLAFCGPGNNGGDGLAVMRMAAIDGIRARVCLVGKRGRLSPSALEQLLMAEEAGVAVEEWISVKRNMPTSPFGDEYGMEQRPGLILDAILGTGMNRAPDEGIVSAVAWINAQREEHGTHVLSIDVPSCLDATSGRAGGQAVRADATVATGWAKTGLLMPNGRKHAGTLHVAPIGIPDELIDLSDAEVLTPKTASTLAPTRPIDGHKGTFGRVLIVAGLSPYAGAAALCALGSLRGGAGLVRVLCGATSLHAVQTHAPEAVALDINDADLAGEIEACDALCIGPGLGMSEHSLSILKTVLRVIGERPAVLDADAINLIASHGLMPPENCVLTPHPGEMARLTGLDIPGIARDPMFVAREMALGYGCTLLLKGSTTVIASPARLTLNLTGNPGMATGGSGDVLSGLIAALLGQGLVAYDAARLGAYLHGCAGDDAMRAHGMHAMTAGDIARSLGNAWLTLGHNGASEHRISQRDALARGYAEMSELNLAWAELGLHTDEAAFRAYEANLPEREET